MLSYSLLILLCLGVSALVGLLYNVKPKFNRAFWVTLAISLVLMLVFNNYLTALPIVVYNMNSILGIKVFTFPVEDIGYLVAVVLLLPALYKSINDERKEQGKPHNKKTSKSKS